MDRFMLLYKLVIDINAASFLIFYFEMYFKSISNVLNVKFYSKCLYYFIKDMSKFKIIYLQNNGIFIDAFRIMAYVLC